MTRLVFIRHGETDWNLEGRYAGQTDVPLNDSGRTQAEALGLALRAGPPEVIYTSDLLRARQTAEILAHATGAPMVSDTRLREIDHGDWEGQLFTRIQEAQGDLVALWRREPLDTRPPGGETMREASERLLRVLDDIVHRHPDGRVAVVSHGGALALLKVHLLGLPVEAVWDHVPRNMSMEEFAWEAE